MIYPKPWSIYLRGNISFNHESAVQVAGLCVLCHLGLQDQLRIQRVSLETTVLCTSSAFGLYVCWGQWQSFWGNAWADSRLQ